MSRPLIHSSTRALIHSSTRPLALPLILLAHLILSVGFSLGPIFEGHDELEHYRYAQYIARTGTLPDPAGQPYGEYHHPPLIYLLAAPVIALIPDSDLEPVEARLNPFYLNRVVTLDDDNKARYVHSADEAFPYTRSLVALAAHLVRLISVLSGLGAVLLAYHTAGLLWPDRPDRAIAAAGLVAFIPNLLYTAATFNNDSLMMLLGAAALYLTLRQYRLGPSYRLSILLGLVLGAGLLAKVGALALAIPVGLAVILDRRAWWPHAPITLAVTLLVGGWWYLNNWLQYGDPTNVQAMLVTWPEQRVSPSGPDWRVGLAGLGYVYQTFWARFGAGAIPVPAWLLRLYDALTALTILGLIAFIIRHLSVLKARTDSPSPRVERGSGGEAFPSPAGGGGGRRPEGVMALILLADFLAWFLALLYITSAAWSGGQPRYLLPAAAVLGIAFAAASNVATLARWRMAAALTSTGILAALAAVCLFAYFLPAYTLKPLPDQIEQPLDLDYEGAARLLGLDQTTLHARPGDVIPLRLYWRALEPTGRPLIATVQTLDPVSYAHGPIGRDSYPGAGKLLSSEWLPGQTWRETLNLIVPADAETQVAYPLIVGFYDPVDGRLLDATSGGSPVTPIVARLVIHGEPQPGDPAYRLGDSIGLDMPVLNRNGDALEVCLNWHSLAATDVDYTVFIHVLSGDGPPLAQSDAQPRAGRYPTSAWLPGEQIADCVTLAVNLPDQGWRVRVGMYTLADGVRLPVADRAGRALPEGAVVIEP